MAASSSSKQKSVALVEPPLSPPRATSGSSSSVVGSGGSTLRSPFTPKARKTAQGRLPVHLLSFEDLSDDDDEGANEGGHSRADRGQPLPPGPSTSAVNLSPRSATAAALRTWESRTPSKGGACGSGGGGGGGGGGFTLRPEDLEFHSRIAEGAYGVVWRARLRRGWQRRRATRRASSLSLSAASSAGASTTTATTTSIGASTTSSLGGWELEEGKPREVAIKVQRIPPAEEDEQGQANLLTELSVLQGLTHPRLVRYHGAALLSESAARAKPEWRPLLVPPSAQQQQQLMQQMHAMPPPEPLLGAEEAKAGAGDDGYDREAAAAAAGSGSESMLVLIAMEHCVRGSLRQALHACSIPTPASAGAGTVVGGGCGMPWPLRVRIAADVAEGLAFLHAHGLLHRDLKTSNVLLDRAWRAKLCDHSFATTAQSPDLQAFACGTDEFLAPEAALGEPPGYDTACDVFSLGVVLCELITGREPGKDGFLCRTPRDLFQLDPAEVEAATSEACPPSLKALALHCAQNEPGDRPTAEEAREWAAALLAELVVVGGGGEGTGAGSAEAVAETAELELPACASPLPWPLTEGDEEEEDDGEKLESGATGSTTTTATEGERGSGNGSPRSKGRKVSWAQVAMRGLGQQPQQQQPQPQGEGGGEAAPHGHKRAHSPEAAGARALQQRQQEQEQEQEAAVAATASGGDGEKRRRARSGDGPQTQPLPGLLGDGATKQAGSAHGNGGRRRGKRGGKRNVGNGANGGKGVSGSGSGSGSSAGAAAPAGPTSVIPTSPPAPPVPPSALTTTTVGRATKGRVGSLDASLSLSLTSSLAASTLAHGRLAGTPKCPLPSSFAAAVASGKPKAFGEGKEAEEPPTPESAGLSALVRRVEGLRLASSSSSSGGEVDQAGRPIADGELAGVGQRVAREWAEAMAAAHGRFAAQAEALQRALAGAAAGAAGPEGQGRGRAAVVRELEALERAAGEEMRKAAGAVAEAVAAFRARVLLKPK